MATPAESAAERATGLLTHYLRHVWEAAGLTWEGDNSTEVALIVDAIADLADAKADERLDVHLADDPHIYPDGSTA